MKGSLVFMVLLTDFRCTSGIRFLAGLFRGHSCNTLSVVSHLPAGYGRFDLTRPGPRPGPDVDGMLSGSIPAHFMDTRP